MSLQLLSYQTEMRKWGRTKKFGTKYFPQLLVAFSLWIASEAPPMDSARAQNLHTLALPGHRTPNGVYFPPPTQPKRPSYSGVLPGDAASASALPYVFTSRAARSLLSQSSSKPFIFC